MHISQVKQSTYRRITLREYKRGPRILLVNLLTAGQWRTKPHPHFYFRKYGSFWTLHIGPVEVNYTIKVVRRRFFTR